MKVHDIDSLVKPRGGVLCQRYLLLYNLELHCICIHSYNSFLVYCRELAPGTVSLTGDRAQGDDSKHDSHYNVNKDATTMLLRLCYGKIHDDVWVLNGYPFYV